MVTKKKTNVNISVTGRTVAYIQKLSKGGKLGKATPFVITTVNAQSPAGTAKAPVRHRRKKK